MRTQVIVGNWKMNLDTAKAKALVEGLRAKLKGGAKCEVGVCPPFVLIPAVVEFTRGSGIFVGGQDMHWEDKGAFTGEVSPPMLKDVGCTHVIIGHSERRQFFGETDETVNKKLKAAFKTGLTPIVCVGERLEEREAGTTEAVVTRQVRGGLAGLTAQQVERLIIAYEPVWAIGTGKTATPAQANEVHALIRRLLAEAHGSAVASKVRIQYGGSVKADNAAELLAQSDIDGALVGGASLDAESFAAIVCSARTT
ncbi:MAG: triose-phosphate isomerase [Planctomycetes bacterium]|nr:triose-phosphate isomerase [Planctomycetota bacterium]